MSTLARVRHTYADVKLLREWLEGSRDSENWTSDLRILRTMLEAATARIDEYVGRSFGPRIETHEFDIGTGKVRQSREFPAAKEIVRPDYWPGGGGRLVELDDWIISATTVTSYEDTARSANTVLTEGIANDFLLWPYNRSPKWLFKMNENSTNQLNPGLRTLVILGVWGWWQETDATGATLGEELDTSEVAIDLSDGLDVSPGATLLIDSEQMYVTSVSGDTVTVERGVNGSTAATHSTGATVYQYAYPPDVVQVCLDIVKNRWRERDAGSIDLIGSGEGQITRPGSEERAILRRLDGYLNRGIAGGVEF